MKTLISLIGLATILVTSGCETDEHARDHLGGYYGGHEYHRGQYHHEPDRDDRYDRDDGYYHR